MTGPEHYREAERLIAMARKRPSRGDLYDYCEDEPATTLILADAQVHATLAHVAATALSSAADARAWAEAAGTRLGDRPPPQG